MTNKQFPKELLGKLKTLVVEGTEGLIEVPYKKIKLVIVSGQLCLQYKGTHRELLMPVGRVSTISKLIKENQCTLPQE